MEGTVISEAVLANYIQLWGKPSLERHFQHEGFNVVVYKWDIGTNPRGANTYATVGLSEYPIPDHHVTHRYELFIDLIPERDTIAESLIEVCLIPYQRQRRVGPRTTVTFDHPLWPGTEMRSMLLDHAHPETIETLHVEQGTHVEFLHIIPIFPSELRFIKDHSLEGLIDRWRERDVPYEDPNRSPEPA